MKARLLTAAMAAILMLAVSASADARGPHRHGGFGRHHRCYATAVVPPVRTVRVRHSSTVNRTSRQERKLMALAYIKNNGYLSVGKYRGITGLDRQFAQAELDSFSLDKKDPIVRTTQGRKVVYTLADE